MRVLVVAHGHPTLNPGGGEIAAHNLFRGLNRQPGVEAHFLARVGPPVVPHGDGPFLAGPGPRETLLHTTGYEPFRLSGRADEATGRAFVRLLTDLRPDVVHFHHFMGLGVELLWLARRTLPGAALVVTLHEYLALCHNNGQMLMTGGRRLCHEASPAACARCFPDIPSARFARRAAFLKTLLGVADLFVSPSRFLIERHVAWGLPAERFRHIHNGVAVPDLIAPPRATPGRRDRFAFFGQVNPFKGLDVLLDAVGMVPAAQWGEDARLLVHGGNLERQSPAFQTEFNRLTEAAGARARFLGGYRNEDLPRLMAGVDWVVVPSVWWENAPVVIQEAFLHGRPVICSGIGGMAEQVRDGVDGLHAHPANPADLADRLGEALADPGLWSRLRAGIRPPPTLDDVAARHVAAYPMKTSAR